MVVTRIKKSATAKRKMEASIALLPPTKIRYSDGSLFPPNSNNVKISNLTHVFGSEIDAITELIVSEFIDDKVSGIFNTKFGKSDGDGDRRYQRVLSNVEVDNNPFLSCLKKQMMYEAKTVNAKYDFLHAMQLLISEEGCAKQLPHTDGTDGGKGKDQFLSCIFTLQDESCFYFDGQKVVIDKCNLLTFHSSKTHNGGEYLKKGNIRIHAYLGMQTTKFPKDRVGIVDVWHCKYQCGRTFCYRSQAYDHHKQCKKYMLLVEEMKTNETDDNTCVPDKY